jgi:glucokinase
MALSANIERLLGIDIGGTKTAIVVGLGDGQILERSEFASQASRGLEPMLADIEAHAASMLARYPGVAGIGVSVGGPVDAEAGMVLGPPNLPGWDAVPLTARLTERFGIATRIEHDAKACALAEWRFGAGRGTRNMVFLTLGTGIGAGIIADGRILRGRGNLAGEVGHWRIAADGPLIYGKRGSFEGWASGAGLPALARHLFPGQFEDVASAATLSARARGGDAAAAAVIDQAASALGRGVALLVDLLAPEAVVLGNLASRLGPDFLAKVEETFADEALPALASQCEIRCCELGDSIGDMAALTIAVEALLEGRES